MRTKSISANELGFDRYWIAALEAVQDRYRDGDLLLAPNEFIHLFDKTVPLHMRRSMIPEQRIDWFLLHKGMRERVDSTIAKEALSLVPHFANEVFVLFGHREGSLPQAQRVHLGPVLDWAADEFVSGEQGKCAALVKTFNRTEFLERCLASIAKMFDSTLVVDDGSSPAFREANAAAGRRVGAEYLLIERNRGAACAFNVGLAALIADLDIEWISTFDDDTDLSAHSVERLRRVARALGPAGRINLYTGYESPYHRVHAEDVVGGERVLLCRSCSGQHMHAHRSYWEGVLPVPTVYAGAPKPTGGVYEGQGDDTDWWCSNWSPRSAVKRGGSVYVLPGLVTTFGRGHSTWGGPGA